MNEWLWSFLLIGYLTTVAVEIPVLLVGLDLPLGTKLKAGLWLTACTYPVVVIVLPHLLRGVPYLAVAETFAPLAECALLRAMAPTARTRDLVTVVVANLASFGFGMQPWT